MLLGEYKHTLDEKNRITIPAKFKGELGSDVIITRGLDESLFVYSKKEWSLITDRLGNLSMVDNNSRKFLRLFFANATIAEIDKSGRVLVTDGLKQYAKLDKNVAVVGVQSRVEIWDSNKWDEYKQSLEDNADTIAEKLGELGII